MNKVCLHYPWKEVKFLILTGTIFRAIYVAFKVAFHTFVWGLDRFVEETRRKEIVHILLICTVIN